MRVGVLLAFALLACGPRTVDSPDLYRGPVFDFAGIQACELDFPRTFLGCKSLPGTVTCGFKGCSACWAFPDAGVVPPCTLGDFVCLPKGVIDACDECDRISRCNY